MDRTNPFPNLISLLQRPPQARASIRGVQNAIRGTVYFYQSSFGVLVAVQVTGLPRGGACRLPIFGFHIHEGRTCTGSPDDPFANVGMHYNPQDCPHPYHAGDLPPLFGANGNAFSVFLSDRFTVDEILNKTIIIHAAPDDFTTQPSGNAGEKLACGEIRSYR